jgi:hypothetical protein
VVEGAVEDTVDGTVKGAVDGAVKGKVKSAVQGAVGGAVGVGVGQNQDVVSFPPPVQSADLVLLTFLQGVFSFNIYCTFLKFVLFWAIRKQKYLNSIRWIWLFSCSKIILYFRNIILLLDFVIKVLFSHIWQRSLCDQGVAVTSSQMRQYHSMQWLTSSKNYI